MVNKYQTALAQTLGYLGGLGKYSNELSKGVRIKMLKQCIQSTRLVMEMEESEDGKNLYQEWIDEYNEWIEKIENN